jgi:hypothetical protein
MHHKPIPLMVLAAVLSACALQPELLNSERIEQRFGNYGIEVLEQDSDVRRSNLYSTDNGVRTCRTYAVVRFIDPDLAEIAVAHRAVLDGQTIGTTFKDAGWHISKKTSYVGAVQVDDRQHVIIELMRLDPPVNAGVHAYQLMLGKGSRSIHYATIVELHHPSYLTQMELMELYPLDTTIELDSDEVDTLMRLVLDAG